MHIFIIWILIFWVLLRVNLMMQNNILFNADGFAYLQMSHYLNAGSLEGLGTWWFGFLYSACISLFDFVVNNSFLSSQIVNLILFFIGGILLFFIAQKYLHMYYNWVLIALYTFSSPLIYYNINILSENLYIVLFLWLVLILLAYLDHEEVYKLWLAWVMVWLMYITRGEAFIYLIPLICISLCVSVARHKELWTFLWGIVTLLLWFFIIAGPYIYYLHSITGEWGLTNKWASNIRQAMMRGIERMDDEGFERAVGELTDDKKHLKSGFVGGLKYEKAESGYGLFDYIEKNQEKFFSTWRQNTEKLFIEIMPKMIIGDFIQAYKSPDFKYKDYTFIYYILFIPLFFTAYGMALMYLDKRRFVLFIFTPFFLTACAFFTMFFVLERYFIILLPLFLLFMVYGMQGLWRKITVIQNVRLVLYGGTILAISLLGLNTYYNNLNVLPYSAKKNAWVWLQKNLEKEFPWKKTVKIMERFPVVTYYSGTWERWLTPYANQADLLAYAKANDIDVLVVDSLDFKTYRPQLAYLLDEKSILKSNLLDLIYKEQKYGEKVILYKIKK